MYAKTLSVLLTFLLCSCYGELVTVPAAHRAKVMLPEGPDKKIVGPSQFNLPWYRKTDAYLVTIDVGDHSRTVDNIVFFHPKDKLSLTIDIRGVYSVSENDNDLEGAFANLSPGPIKDSVAKITFDGVYDTYALPRVMPIVRQVLANTDSIQFILDNREALSMDIAERSKTALKGTPIGIRSLELSDVDPPEVIKTAQEVAKTREIEIEKAQAEKLIKLTEAQAALEVAKKQQEIDLLEAETQVLVDKKLAEGVNEAFVKQRALKILERMSENAQHTFFFTEEVLHNPASLLASTIKAVNGG